MARSITAPHESEKMAAIRAMGNPNPGCCATFCGTKAGLAAARARGRNGGRPKAAAEETKVVLAKKLHADKSVEIDDICQTLRISRSTFYR